MKLLLLLSFLATSASVNARELAGTQFTIDGGTAPASWDPLKDDTNSVTITFGINGETSSEFNTLVSHCSDEYVAGEFSMTAPVSTTADSAADVVVTFTNLKHMDATASTACVDVSLFVDDITAAVATRRFTYAITSDQSGSDVSVTATKSDITGVNNNAMAVAADTDSVTHSMAFTPSVMTAGAIQYGETFQVDVPSQPGFDLDVTAVSPGTIDSENGPGWVSHPTDKTVYIKLPLSSFVTDTTKSQLVTMTVEWQVNHNAYGSRALRGLISTDPEEPQHGTIDYTLSVDIIPYEEGSYAYTLSPVTYCASAAMASVASMLL